MIFVDSGDSIDSIDFGEIMNSIRSINPGDSTYSASYIDSSDSIGSYRL